VTACNLLTPVPTAVPSPSPDQGIALAALLTHVPDEMRVNCGPVRMGESGEVVSAQCYPVGASYVSYAQFDTLEHLRAAYTGDVNFFGAGASGTNCQAGPSESIYSIDGASAGRLLCNAETTQDAQGKITIWTHEGLLILSTIMFYGSFSGMYDIWLAAGPNS